MKEYLIESSMGDSLYLMADNMIEALELSLPNLQGGVIEVRVTCVTSPRSVIFTVH